MSKLIFVYNADSSLFARTLDHLHKTFSPSTYQCNLCALTYNNLGMKRSWKRFLMRFPHKKVFLHKDELQKRYPSLGDLELPVALIENEGEEPKVLISAEEMNQFSDLKELQSLLKEKLTS